MDLNASPLPEEDEQPFQEQVEDEIFEPAFESSVQTLHREREERRRRLKREYQDEELKRHPQSARNDLITQNKTSKYAGKIRPIPEGWMDCPPFGKWLGGNIVPSKVPLDETYNDAVLPGKRYSSKQVINGQRRFGRELGLVVDLTNTTRYYSPSEYTKLGIKHIKIACKGRDAVPDNASVNRFVYEVMQFIGRQKHSRKNVLVHCTHGHNRTGFMIVHYLVRTKLCSVTEALHEFEVARPPGIYKRDYIEALYSFYHESPEKMICPSTPEWKRSSELDLNGEAIQDQDDDEDGDSTSLLHLQEQHVENGPITNDDVLGDAVCYDEQEFLRQKCYSLFEIFPTGKGTSQFPGSHPVSLNRDNLQLLRQRYYYATWKADGTRYMMLIALHGCYLIDRNFCFRRVQLRFPSKVEFEGYYFHHYTLIDGEMIIDTVPDIGLKRRYLAYDLIALNNQSVVKLPFSERWKLLEEEVIKPRNNEKKYIEREGKGNLTYRYELEPFGVRRKDFWLLSTVGKLLKGFIPSLSHDSDGLIFQGWDDPYVPRTHEGLLKWKYPEMNSVDFLFEIGPDNRQSLYLYERGKKKLMDGSKVSFKDDEDANSFSGKIVECSWDQERRCWVCMRVRTDKSTPNDINTCRKVMRSISDNITQEVLLKEISEILSLPMYADRIEKLQQQQHRRR